eukprot:GHVU01216642.1.p1 GENE.GHVU01216642.1~~GHVU01216642.1.p1  ORF type:complete len:331 (-),score=30.92 GHVU01216642.1:214-1206(-)
MSFSRCYRSSSSNDSTAAQEPVAAPGDSTRRCLSVWYRCVFYFCDAVSGMTGVKSPASKRPAAGPTKRATTRSATRPTTSVPPPLQVSCTTNFDFGDVTFRLYNVQPDGRCFFRAVIESGSVSGWDDRRQLGVYEFKLEILAKIHSGETHNTLERLLNRIYGRGDIEAGVAPTLDVVLKRGFAELTPEGEKVHGPLPRDFWADNAVIYATAIVLRLRILILEKRLDVASGATKLYVLDTDTVVKKHLATKNPHLYKDERSPIVFLYRHQAGRRGVPVVETAANHYAFAELVKPVKKEVAAHMCRVASAQVAADSDLGSGSRADPLLGDSE